MRRESTIVAIAIVTLGLLTAGADEVRTQLWMGEQGCYGGEHLEFVLRETVTECETGDGGWGRLVELGEQSPIHVRIQWDRPPDEYLCQQTIVAYIYFVIFDDDVDGDVDLIDFTGFQVAMTGPRSNQ